MGRPAVTPKDAGWYCMALASTVISWTAGLVEQALRNSAGMNGMITNSRVIRLTAYLVFRISIKSYKTIGLCGTDWPNGVSSERGPTGTGEQMG